MRETEPAAARLPLLFLIADTGGGHRSAARAVGAGARPDVSGPVRPGAVRPAGRAGLGVAAALGHRPVRPGHPAGPVAVGRRLSRLRLAPGHVRCCGGRCCGWPTGQRSRRPRAHRPAAIVSFHPLTGSAAVAARDLGAPGAPVVTVVTDLARMHAAWRTAGTDVIIAPRPPAAGHGCGPRPACR